LNFEAIIKKNREQLEPFLCYALRGGEGQACNTAKRGRNVHLQGIVGDNHRSGSRDAVGGACGNLSVLVGGCNSYHNETEKDRVKTRSDLPGFESLVGFCNCRKHGW
jgi:hypothetical protein